MKFQMEYGDIYCIYCLLSKTPPIILPTIYRTFTELGTEGLQPRRGKPIWGESPSACRFLFPAGGGFLIRFASPATAWPGLGTRWCFGSAPTWWSWHFV